MTSAVAAGAARRARVRAARDLGRGPDGPVHIRAAGSGRTGRARCGRAGVRERGSGHMRVLGVVGHVPREETDQGVRVYGARVLQHVRGHRTARVLGNEVEPRHRLAEQDGNDPEPEQQGAAGDGGECADHDAARQVRSRLANDPGALAASDVRLRHPPRRESRDHADLAHPVLRSADPPSVLAPLAKGGDRGLGVALRILGAAVVLEVECTEETGRQASVRWVPGRGERGPLRRNGFRWSCRPTIGNSV